MSLLSEIFFSLIYFILTLFLVNMRLQRIFLLSTATHHNVGLQQIPLLMCDHN